ncbi:MAG: hypothetical protein WEA80_09720 [Gemmatimonadaceae bacterium]
MRAKIMLLAALVVGAVGLVPKEAQAIPAFARKYNMNCSGCHSPAVPRLNAKGFAFKWAGFRMPEEIGENQEVRNVSQYLATRFRFRYVYAKTETESASTNAFRFVDATLFAAGSLGKNYGVFVEVEHEADETGVMAAMQGVWGRESRYWGARVGQMHWLISGGVAGFDRPTGINRPTPVGNATTKAVPFRLSRDQLGVETFFVLGKNRLSFEVLNGVNPEGNGMEGASPSTKDFAVIEQFVYDDAGSGIGAAVYSGAVADLDPDVTGTAHYTRLALTANKIFKTVELLGGYVYSRDRDLPVSVSPSSSMTGSAYWVYGGYTFPNSLTLFGRYEFLDTNKDVADQGNERFVLGSVLPVSLPEYLRLGAEYTLDIPRPPGALKKTGFALEVMLNF